MGVKNIFTLIICSIGFMSFAQNDSIVNEYITIYPNKISAKLYVLNTSNRFVISDRNSNLDNKITLVPNERYQIGVGVLFRSISVYFGFTPKVFSVNDYEDDSKLVNFGLEYRFGKHWLQALAFYYEKGFHAEEHKDGLDLYFPEMKTFKIGGSTAYVLNENFSFKTSGFANEWQSKSTGSFVPRVYYYYTKYTLKKAGFPDDSHSYDLVLAPGYFYNWIIADKFIVSPGATAGIGMNYTEYDGSKLISATYEVGFSGLVGYNTQKFYAGAKGNAIFLKHNFDRGTRVNDKTTLFEFYVGYRFPAPKKFVDAAKKYKF